MLALGRPNGHPRLHCISPHAPTTRACLHGARVAWLHMGSPCMRPIRSHTQAWPAAAAGGYASIQKKGEGAVDSQPALGQWGDTEAMVRQQKNEDRDATPNLLLKHPDATLATYVWRQMKHIKHAYETLAATPDPFFKHQNETLAIYLWNS
jgi:hypothetical protein